MVECHLAKVVVEGSSPLARSKHGVVEAVNGSIAQLVEQVTLNHWVVGSNPSAPTIHLKESREGAPFADVLAR